MRGIAQYSRLLLYRVKNLVCVDLCPGPGTVAAPSQPGLTKRVLFHFVTTDFFVIIHTVVSFPAVHSVCVQGRVPPRWLMNYSITKGGLAERD